MAAKIKCPACGAKNDATATRCRICAAMIVAKPAAPPAAAPPQAPPPPMAPAPMAAAPPPPPAGGPAAPAPPMAAPPVAAPPVAAPGGAVPGGAVPDPAAAGVAGPRRTLPPGYPGAPPAYSASQGGLPDSAIQINVQSRHPGNVPPPPDTGERIDSIPDFSASVQPRHLPPPPPAEQSLDEAAIAHAARSITIDESLARRGGAPTLQADDEVEAFKRGGGGIVIEAQPRHPGDPAPPSR